MRDVGGNILFSASDLMRFMGCSHATTLDLERLRGEGPEPREANEDAARLSARQAVVITGHGAAQVEAACAGLTGAAADLTSAHSVL